VHYVIIISRSTMPILLRREIITRNLRVKFLSLISCLVYVVNDYFVAFKH
jgi:hypothetical protein